MTVRNIWKQIDAPLELHTDARGRIVDVFYKEDIAHVSVIDSHTGALRGNHYHKQTTQRILMTHGSMEYWYKAVDSRDSARHVVIHAGDLVSTPPFEIHALKILEPDSQFIVFTSGLRGGRDYESDTYRVESIFPPEYRTEPHD